MLTESFKSDIIIWVMTTIMNYIKCKRAVDKMAEKKEYKNRSPYNLQYVLIIKFEAVELARA